jgi:hypothetical protein
VNGEVELWIGADYLDEVELGAITPEPTEVRSTGNRLVFVFAVDDPAQPVRISIGYTPQEMGRIQATMGINDGPGIEYTQFGYP